MPEFKNTFYIEDEHGKRTPLDRMTRAQCEEVICSMAEEIAYWRRLDFMLLGAIETSVLADEDAAGATIQ